MRINKNRLRKYNLSVAKKRVKFSTMLDIARQICSLVETASIDKEHRGVININGNTSARIDSEETILKPKDYNFNNRMLIGKSYALENDINYTPRMLLQ